MEWVPPQNNTRGRLRKSWGEGIKKAMSEWSITDKTIQKVRGIKDKFGTAVTDGIN